MTTRDIENLVGRTQVLKGHSPVCRNVKSLLSDWEHDVISLSENGMLYEFEVKVSRGDFLAEKKKGFKWECYTQPLHSKCPNYFFYVCMPGLIKIEDLPEFAGLIYVVGEKLVVQKKKSIHKVKHNREKLFEKICRINQEREFLGCSLFRHKRKQIES